MNKKIVTLGDVMMRLSTKNKERFSQASGFDIVYGGAEANVAISLAQFGCESIHVTAFPSNDLGYAATAYLRKFGVNTDFIQFQEGRLGLYFLEDSAMQRASKIVYDRYDSAFAAFDGKLLDWDMVFDGVDWFHWTGITPALSQKAADLTLDALKAAQDKGIIVSADINYRRNLWQYGKGPLEVMPELIRYSHVLVAGSSDFENCMDIVEDDYEDACRQAQKDFPQIKYITKTKRESISASHNKLRGHLWNGKEILKSTTYDMPNIVDRIGGGDAFLAGLVYGLLHYDDQTALEFATAASVLKHSIPGDANLASVDEVLTLMKGENVGKLLR
ncbi:PfkB family carbohydrate kinase [Shivajiella indica]|uniref:PfkB family carbohydrate kinase n=1 Tax=Shivajiella indica TaxID=872115 RepID=A0ABW5B9F1_9BACT